MNIIKKSTVFSLYFTIFLFFINSTAQTSTELNSQQKQKSEFWKKVRFGGGFGLNIGSGFTDITLAPSAIYEINEYLATGIGLQGSYIRVKPRNSAFENYEAYTYGGSWLVLVNPIQEIQLSGELEQLRVNVNYDDGFSDNFWNTALFLGGGYRAQNVTIGIRYNVLHNSSKNIYSEAFMPFVRVYF